MFIQFCNSRECGADPTCVLCQKCFRQSEHINHKYKVIYTVFLYLERFITGVCNHAPCLHLSWIKILSCFWSIF